MDIALDGNVQKSCGQNFDCVLYSGLCTRKEEIMADNLRPPNGPLADLGAYLGPGTKVNGKLQFDGATTIDGEVDGEIIAHGNITVGQQATIKGKISAQSIVVHGKVMADIQAEKKLEIQPPGMVMGDVTTNSLVIGDGAILEGHCSMKKEKEGRILPLRQEPKEPKTATSKEGGS